MKCGFEDLPLNTNHICPEYKRPIHAVCVGRHLEDAPLGMDIICFDCIEDEELAHESEGNGTTPVTTATIGGVTYKLTSLELGKQGDHCSYKVKRGYKCIHDKHSLNELVPCSTKDCAFKSHLCCYLNFLGKALCSLFSFTVFILIYFFVFVFFSEITSKDPIYCNDILQVTCSKSCYNVTKSNLVASLGSGTGTTGVKWHNGGIDTSSFNILLQWLMAEGNYNIRARLNIAIAQR
jgi:hypothetical protein